MQVGYGDYYAQSPLEQGFVAGYALFGTILLLAILLLGRARLGDRRLAAPRARAGRPITSILAVRTSRCTERTLGWWRRS